MGIFLGRGTTVEKRLATFPEPPIAPFPGANLYGNVTATTTPDLALSVPAVWACVSLLAGAVSSLPLETFRRSVDVTATDLPRRIPNPPLIDTPDETFTQSEWLHMVMVSLLMRGNCYGRITERDATFHPMKMRILNPDSIRVKVDRETGEIAYHVALTDKVIPKQDMWHVRGLTLPGSRIGLSPIAYAAATIGVDLSSRQFASGFFDGGGIPKAVLESDQQIQQDQARTIKDRVMNTFRGREPLVLGQGLKYTQIQVKPEESQFLLTQQADVTQIARYFSVPAAMIDGPAGGGMQYSNTEQRGIEFVTYSLAHWLKRLEDALFVALPGQQFVRFNTAQLLRTDAETQAKVFVQLLAGKVITPTEVRAELGRDPMTKAQQDEIDLVPLNITALGGARLDKAQQTKQEIQSDGGEQGTQTESKPTSPAPAPKPDTVKESAK